MKNLSKMLTLVLALVLMLTVFTACGNKDQAKPEETTPVENATEEKPEEPAEEAPTEVVEVGPIAKIGLGNITSTTSSKDAGDKAAKGQADVTVAAVAFDADGKIVDVKIDVAQTSAAFSEDNMKALVDDSVDYRTKMEKGPDYGMLKASPIGKEFNEQIVGLQDYLIGKTADEVVGIATKQKDEHHTAVPDVAELETSCTIDIGAFQHVVKEAWDNAVDANGATKLGLGVYTDGKGTDGKDDKGAKIQFNTYMCALGLDDQGKIVANYIDTVQPKIEVALDGTIVEKIEDVQSKKELEDGYGMRKASEIGKEWFEQMNDFQEFTIGKTVEEVQGIPVKERDAAHKSVPDLPELETTVTISVEGYQKVMGLAGANANK
ncbi:MAG: hypothetical protein Q4E36_03915 [Bacillota bacterium]|nr:hypothetical protein [Bacillota bacterium]